jgi:hypothetical protein
VEAGDELLQKQPRGKPGQLLTGYGEQRRRRTACVEQVRQPV